VSRWAVACRHHCPVFMCPVLSDGAKQRLLDPLVF
jgi:hypothetical protein